MNQEKPQQRSAASRRLHAMDTAAEFVVTLGGFVVLAAVLGICVYLLWVVLPLFERGKLGTKESGTLGLGEQHTPAWVVLDPYNHSATTIDRSFNARTFLIQEGQVTGDIDLLDGEDEPSAVSMARQGETAAAGFEDGTVRMGSLRYRARVETLPDDASSDPAHPVKKFANGYIEDLGQGRGRSVVFEGDFGDPIELSEGSGGVVAIDYRKDPTGKEFLAALRADSTVLVNSVRTIRPLGGGPARKKLRTRSFRLVEVEHHPDWFLVSADGEHVLCLWRDGHGQRYSLFDGEFGLRERFDVVEGGDRVSTANMLLGGLTLLVGLESGTTEAFHVTDDLRGEFSDGRKLVRSHRIEGDPSPIISVAPSLRDRSVVIVHQDGVTEWRHMTSEKLVARVESGVEGPVTGAISPKNDGLFVLGADGGYSFDEIEPGYPEFSMKALFGKVYYEGVDAPQYVYQSSSGDDASEIKLSLMPLIFGTLKATVFAMIFAIPMGVLAAIYSSEFISKRVRRKVKPTVELMASLPSVVLGFIAAMVVAPFVAAHLSSFVIGLVVVPLTILLAAHLWQLVPLSVRLRTRTGQHMMIVSLALLLGGVMSMAIGPGVVRSWFMPDAFDSAMLAGAYEPVPEAEQPSWADEAIVDTRSMRRLRGQGMALVGSDIVRPIDQEMHQEALVELGLEHGDLRRWLNDEYGRAFPGWLVAFFPVGCIIAWVGQAFLLRRRMDLWVMSKPAPMIGGLMLAKFVVLAFSGFVLAAVAAKAMELLGFDPRDSVFGSFSPRNTLVVAIIMGFAVIPIIYTISEDALQAVPMTLRTASLGSGATPWQTATRVVLPVAASGIFSACMIGFGRAVGETMIVLMATGNTPEMEWNIFSGFRTLAANIAVELPEAPKDETHYRVLFLCGFVLFVMTFVINTAAELVRRVVRARNAGL